MTTPPGPVLVITPTYDERENLEVFVDRLRAAVPRADLLVVDDNSPDGTGALADRLAAADGQVHVLHRPGKLGLGTAYLAGFDWGLRRGYQVLVQMDTDGSHQPEQLETLLAALERADLVLGSRWVPGGQVVGRSPLRTLISRAGTAYARLLLGMPTKDVTGGYRAFRADTLRALDLDGVESAGYCFQLDLAWRARRRGLRAVEVPITLVERQRGVSKISGGIVAESLVRVTGWGLRHRLDQLRRRGRAPARPGS